MRMFCTKCGAQVNDEAKFCGKCGNAVSVPVSSGSDARKMQHQQQPVATPQVGVKYAGFWIRFAAHFIDGIITNIIIVVVATIAALLFNDAFSEGLGGILALISIPAYYILLTYKKGATWGKMAVGIKVISSEDKNLGIWTVVARETIGKIASLLTLCIGFAMAGFTERKQALHDKIAQTYVVYKDPNKQNNTWIVILILIPIIIAVIGILASIVLVSLSSAREKAREASFKAQVSSIVPQALLACDQGYITSKDLYASTGTQDFDSTIAKNSLKQNCGNDSSYTFSFKAMGIGDYKKYSADCSESGCNFHVDGE